MAKKPVTISLDEELLKAVDRKLEGIMPRSWYIATLMKKDLKEGGKAKH